MSPTIGKRVRLNLTDDPQNKIKSAIHATLNSKRKKQKKKKLKFSLCFFYDDVKISASKAFDLNTKMR